MATERGDSVKALLVKMKIQEKNGKDSIQTKRDFVKELRETSPEGKIIADMIDPDIKKRK